MSGVLTGWLYDGNNDTGGVPGYLPVHGAISGGVVSRPRSWPVR
jgi:hypothetical protein